MKNLPQISDAEFGSDGHYLEVCPISTNEITDRLAKTGLESENTSVNGIPPGKKGVIVHEKGKPSFCLYALREER